jgi:hypothetical protein
MEAFTSKELHWKEFHCTRHIQGHFILKISVGRTSRSDQEGIKNYLEGAEGYTLQQA